MKKIFALLLTAFVALCANELKFGFAYSLAQILEPKLLVHEILNLVDNS